MPFPKERAYGVPGRGFDHTRMPKPKCSAPLVIQRAGFSQETLIIEPPIEHIQAINANSSCSYISALKAKQDGVLIADRYPYVILRNTLRHGMKARPSHRTA